MQSSLIRRKQPRGIAGRQRPPPRNVQSWPDAARTLFSWPNFIVTLSLANFENSHHYQMLHRMLRPDLTLKKYKSAEKTLPRLAMEKYVKKGGKENGGGIWVRAFGQLHTPPPPAGHGCILGWQVLPPPGRKGGREGGCEKITFPVDRNVAWGRLGHENTAIHTLQQQRNF